jgi:VanZ family protein
MMPRYRWALLWALLILVLCLMPGAALPAWHWADLFSVDKLVHAGLFAVQALLVLRAAGGQGRADAFPWLLAVVAYGGALELMQMLPALGRRGDWNDLAANTLGALLGWAWHRWRSGSQRTAAIASDA